MLEKKSRGCIFEFEVDITFVISITVRKILSWVVSFVEIVLLEIVF